MSIFCIGQSAYDIIIPMEEPIIENQKYRVTEWFESGGGPAFNAAFLCALWGADACLISRLGQDEYGKRLGTIMEAAGVRLEYLIEDNEIQTPHSIIFSNVKAASRTLFNFPGKQKAVEYPFPEEDVDVILSDGHEREISLDAIKAYPNAASVVDAGTCREGTLAVAKESDYLVCSEDFARQYTSKSINLEDWEICESVFHEVEQINQKHTVITLGAVGLLYRKQGVITHMPAYPAAAVDTNGAGDVFHGAFAYGLWKGLGLTEILKLSSMAAAISVQTYGGQTSIPRLEHVLEKIMNPSDMPPSGNF